MILLRKIISLAVVIRPIINILTRNVTFTILLITLQRRQGNVTLCWQKSMRLERSMQLKKY
jgi:hypothetical protein